MEELENQLSDTRRQMKHLQNLLRKREDTIIRLRVEMRTKPQQLEIEGQRLYEVRMLLRQNRRKARELLNCFFNDQLMFGATFSLAIPFAEQIRDFIWTVSQQRI